MAVVGVDMLVASVQRFLHPTIGRFVVWSFLPRFRTRGLLSVEILVGRLVGLDHTLEG